MKRIRIALLILLVTIAAAALLWRNLNHTSDVGLHDFAVSNPDKITKIFFSPNNSKRAQLTFNKKNQGEWMVSNGSKEYPADTSSVSDLIYYVLSRLETVHPVNDASVENVTRELASDGIKVLVYAGKSIIKTIYVGGPTYDQMGTYMYLPDSKRPCVVTVPGHQGYLTPYFNSQINNWRSAVLFNTPSPEIASISVRWAGSPEQSFQLSQNGATLVMKDGNGRDIPNFNRNAALAYLEMFTGVSRESGELPGINKNRSFCDSLIKSIPFLTISLADKSGSSTTLHIYYRPVTEETYSQMMRSGELKKFESDSYWAVVDGSPEIWIIQDAIFRNRMKKISDFIRN